MSVVMLSNAAQIQSVLQALALEIALIEPGTQGGLAEIEDLFDALVNLLPPASANEFAAMVEAGHKIVAGLLDRNTAWDQKTIEEFSFWFAAVDQAAQDLVLIEANLDRIQTPTAAVEAQDSSELDETPLVLAVQSDRELLAEFCNEGRDLLLDIENGVLVLEDDPTQRETLNSVFRAFHTFKGGAGFLGLVPIKNLAHELESLLDAIRQNKIAISRGVIDLILAGGDRLRQFVDLITRELETPSKQPLVVPTARLIERVVACLAGEDFEHPPQAVQMVPPVETSAQEVIISPVLPNASAVGDADGVALSQPIVPSVAQRVPHTPAGKAKNPAPAALSGRSGAESGEAAAAIRITIEKLDTLVDLVAELVIAQAMVVQNPELSDLGDHNLSRDILVLQRITKDLQHNAMSLRMVPIRGAFQKITRLVRDLAASQDKQIQLLIQGEETEIDRNIVGELSDPLIHMVRNSCDHGIETPQERIAAGKPAMGTIRLSAFHQGGGIVVKISDDGKGLDPERIYKKAVERGMIEDGVQVSKEEIFDFIFAPGFSTAAVVTDLSGRGVGMDVVRGNISKLRGRIEVSSDVGVGTTFTIFLPLTLAIIDGMVVGVGDNRYVIPTLAVRESFRPTPDMISTVFDHGKLVRKRDQLIPLIHLGDLLGIPYRHSDAAEAIVILVEAGTTQRCIVVDSLIGKSEIVIKDLGPAFESQTAMSGAAIMGDGRVALILDVDAIVSQSQSGHRSANTGHRKDPGGMLPGE
ncbi:MAG: chemotaxis protein CheA [Pseudomonadota bacterium]